MKKVLKKFEKWFDLNLGWFFTNGNKQEKSNEYLMNKYSDKETKK